MDCNTNQETQEKKKERNMVLRKLEKHHNLVNVKRFIYKSPIYSDFFYVCFYDR